MTGKLLGHYRVLEKIGAGAMGEVYRARDERLGRDVAIKVIRPASSDNADHLRRFEQEARAAAALNHPNILAIFDVGFEGSTPYIVSELLEGQTVRARLTAGPISPRQAADYALQIAQGLTAAHERRIIHRDLKPENLFLTNDGRVKILDFGIAKLQAPPEEKQDISSAVTVTKSGAFIGTYAYMSPEQLRGKAIDHRSDIFSFGTVLYEILSGKRAFQGETEIDTMTAILREEPAEANLEQAAIPLGYRDIVRHCLEKEPENRFQSAKDLAFALQTITGSSSGRHVAAPAPKRAGGKAIGWAVASLLAVALALSLAELWQPITQPEYTRLTFESGTVYAARFTPGGDSMLYSADWNNGGFQIFSTVGSSTLAQPLNLKGASLLAVSNTGELALALHGTHNGQLEVAGGTLARAPLAGGSPHEILSNVRWADWDGSGNLAVVHYVDGKCRLEYPIGKVLYQTAGFISNIRFSPRFDQIAFMDHPALWDNRGNVSVTDLSGHVRALTQEWESEQGLAWRRDGKEIWFSAVEKGNALGLKAVDLDKRLRTVLNLPIGLTLQDMAGDGRVLLTLNNRRLNMAFSTLGGKEDYELSWHDWNVAKDISPDGQFVVFEDSSEAAGASYSVNLRRLDGSLPARLGEGSAGGLSPDGKWAVAISVTAGTVPRVTLLPTGPGEARSLNVSGLEHVRNGWARFLADGKGVTIDANVAGHNTRCYRLDVDGAAPQPLTPEGIFCGPISPDDRWMAVESKPDAAEAGKTPTLNLYPLKGDAMREVPLPDPAFLSAQWSPDGRSMIGTHPGQLPTRIYRLDFATGKETQIHELHPGAPAGVVFVAPVMVSRDGRHFLYSYNQTLSGLFLVSGLR